MERVFVCELVRNGNNTNRRRMYELLLHRMILYTTLYGFNRMLNNYNNNNTSMYETGLFFSEGKSYSQNCNWLYSV